MPDQIALPGAWHWRAMITSRHFEELAHRNEPLIILGDETSCAACEKAVCALIYPPLRVNIWYDTGYSVLTDLRVGGKVNNYTCGIEKHNEYDE